ncbi:hypothetical protein B0H13DRAFT_1884904 [Mycena leptocephala]|nr:hypothetical protein B0H13DRAFT_1884904 [Mycena leptocephala]
MYSNVIERGWVYEIPTVCQSIFPSNKVQVGDLGKEPEPLSTPYVVYRSSLYAYWSLVVMQFSSEPKSRLGEPVFEPSDANSASSASGSDPRFGCLSETRMRIRGSAVFPRQLSS